MRLILIPGAWSDQSIWEPLAAARFPEKIAGLIFIVAFLPENGKSLLQVAGLDEAAETSAIEQNNGLWPPPTKEELMDQPFLSESQKHYLLNKMVGHPGKTVTDKAKIHEGALDKMPKFYIGADFSNSIKANPVKGSINFEKLDGGHWPMLSKSKELAGIIKDLQI
ncbi:hypothetical protein [Echinicola vietnamensis]|uniref:Hydrolase or acyltransferase of alpha/beta superfamily n=1 Tax=Echinicola vietnamensis (strain DSM 17526 / LMG 23754 / KMM 6221) TaxID=926556 RepID=L0G4Q6_ECHVK|nr:hypothetical protein [Echinicola vietnamensis]AGA80492.1 hypothetical protein Echvi_4301 [Echinicola vietnamensis DSM 17526]